MRCSVTIFFRRQALGQRTKQVALVGRSNRPYANNQPTHRLRLDRYDDVDFEQLREKMVADGLWVLAGTECVKS